jgi:polyisoprenoid-binding protein YceI
MSRQTCISWLALAIAASACKSTDGSTETRAASAEPARSTADVTHKATDPASLKTLVLDPSASKFDFDASKITNTNHGSFKQFSGNATTIDGELRSIAVEVDTATLEADDPKLAAHLKTADFLDVEKFPKATFKSSSIVAKPAGGATHEVTGDLTLHGVTQQITFPATVEITPTAVKSSAEVRINRQKFGVTYPGMPDDLIKDEVLLKPRFVFAQK